MVQFKYLATEYPAGNENFVPKQLHSNQPVGEQLSKGVKSLDGISTRVSPMSDECPTRMGINLSEVKLLIASSNMGML